MALQHERAKHYIGGKSFCYCGHTGDGAESEHGGLNGHGACHLCDCPQFTWKEWTPLFEQFLRAELQS